MTKHRPQPQEPRLGEVERWTYRGYLLIRERGYTRVWSDESGQPDSFVGNLHKDLDNSDLRAQIDAHLDQS